MFTSITTQTAVYVFLCEINCGKLEQDFLQTEKKLSYVCTLDGCFMDNEKKDVNLI